MKTSTEGKQPQLNIHYAFDHIAEGGGRHCGKRLHANWLACDNDFGGLVVGHPRIIHGGARLNPRASLADRGFQLDAGAGRSLFYFRR